MDVKHYDKLIFVSESDTITSPMAEAILSRHFLLEKAEAVLVSQGLTMKDHMSDPLDEADFDDRTLILTITNAEKERLLQDFANPINVFSLSEYIRGEGEVHDPYGGSLGDYGQCFRELDAQVERLAGILQREELN